MAEDVTLRFVIQDQTPAGPATTEKPSSGPVSLQAKEPPRTPEKPVISAGGVPIKFSDLPPEVQQAVAEQAPDVSAAEPPRRRRRKPGDEPAEYPLAPLDNYELEPLESDMPAKPSPRKRAAPSSANSVTLVSPIPLPVRIVEGGDLPSGQSSRRSLSDSARSPIEGTTTDLLQWANEELPGVLEDSTREGIHDSQLITTYMPKIVELLQQLVKLEEDCCNKQSRPGSNIASAAGGVAAGATAAAVARAVASALPGAGAAAGSFGGMMALGGAQAEMTRRRMAGEDIPMWLNPWEALSPLFED